MSDTSPACCCLNDFETQYETFKHPVFLELERRVLGSDYGGTSWTTREQADRIPRSLQLDSGTHLLELGAGAGWPAVYLAAQSGCEITLLDLPHNALLRAVERAQSENLRVPLNAICASGSELPFARGSFDALGHSDVLCCLPDKLDMLKECRRVARPGARMLFYVIAPAPGLSDGKLEAAIEAGPPFVDMEDDYIGMLDASRWRLLGYESLTDSYLASLLRMVDEMQSNHGAFRDVIAIPACNDVPGHAGVGAVPASPDKAFSAVHKKPARGSSLRYGITRGRSRSPGLRAVLSPGGYSGE
jgi:SAM-dependent methyltransferase